MESKDYNWADGLKQMPELAKDTKDIVFTVKDEAFLEGIFNSGITDVLKENYAEYESEIDKLNRNRYIPTFAIDILKNTICTPPQRVSFVYDDKDLFEDYRSELTALKISIPTTDALCVKKVDSNLLITEYGWNNKCDILIGKPEDDSVTILTDMPQTKRNKYLDGLQYHNETRF